MGKLSHWDQYSCNIVKAGGKGAFEGCCTEHTRDTCELVQAAHTEVAQVCTGVQVTMRTSLFPPLVPSLQKLSSLCYLINVTLLTLNWHGYKSWEARGGLLSRSVFSKMSLDYSATWRPTNVSCGKVVVGMEEVYVFWELYYMFKHTSIILTAESL